MSDPIRPSGYFYSDSDDPYAGAFWSQFQDPHELAARHAPTDSSPAAAMKAYRAYRDRVRKPVLATYTVLGFLSSGTYGRVYKARLRSPTQPGLGNTSSSSAAASGLATGTGTGSSIAVKKRGLLQQHQMLDSPSASSMHPTPRSTFDGSVGAHATPTASPGLNSAHTPSTSNNTGRNETTQLPAIPDNQVYAIKKFKPDTKETDATIYTGISQSAMREISLNRELSHVNIVTLHQVMLEDKAIYMVFEYAEHDLLQIIHYHSTALRAPIPLAVLKSLLWQLINGVAYLHANWILHRDLKPANILVTNTGVVKIGDLGLARLYSSPLQSLYNGDKVVVTIWYRAPELLLGARHYTTAIDMWSVGCIWGELLALRPMFKGEEAKMDPKTKAAPFQTDQLKRIVEVLGTPNKDRWPAIETMPDYKGWWPHLRLDNYPKTLSRWYASRNKSDEGYELFDSLLQYDPEQRLSALESLEHAWFTNAPVVTANAFASLPKPMATYPNRRVIQDDLDPKMRSNYQPPIETHHLGKQSGNSNNYRLAQLLHQQENLRHQAMQLGSSTTSTATARANAITVPVAPTVGGPAAPPPITIGTAGLGMHSTASSSDTNIAPPPIAPPSATSTGPPTAKSIEHDTPTTTATAGPRENLVATATRNHQRKRQKF